MGNYKWDLNEYDESLGYVVVFMVSRNKDNKDVPDFKERKRSMFITYDMDRINRSFNHFVQDALSGEFCRLYISVNKRNPSLVRKQLLHMLIDKENFSFLISMEL